MRHECSVLSHHGSVSEMHALQMQRVVEHRAPWQRQKCKCSVLSFRNLKNINGACGTWKKRRRTLWLTASSSLASSSSGFCSCDNSWDECWDKSWKLFSSFCLFSSASASTRMSSMSCVAAFLFRKKILVVLGEELVDPHMESHFLDPKFALKLDGELAGLSAALRTTDRPAAPPGRA